MITVEYKQQMSFDQIPVDPMWNTGAERELKMHKIHAYPAKFPAFITTKALEYASQNSLKVRGIADIFCGCGTVAFEARRNEVDFWGCDTNPVATLIARAKSNDYKDAKLSAYFQAIVGEYHRKRRVRSLYEGANERLLYWYSEEQFDDLHRLKTAIEVSIPPQSKYRRFFLCAFSNILKATSRWLTKSIKPQIDPNKEPANVLQAFQAQFHFMRQAVQENDVSSKLTPRIEDGSFLSDSVLKPKVDMIITSPPYVTSYEYADLHQLSSLWLGFTDDYRELREGSIGSLHHSYNFDREVKRLNATGTEVVFRLMDQFRGKARAVAKYYLDMQTVAVACQKMLNRRGMALFVIGDTEYKGVTIKNAMHLTESLYQAGFREVRVSKRKVSGKILTPYRDSSGKFSRDSAHRRVYAEEFIVIGVK